MQHPFDILTLPNGGKFIFTPCPGTKEVSVADTIAQFKAAGVATIITTLSNNEIKQLGVPELADEIKQANIAWYQLPIEDDCAPTQNFQQRFSQVKKALLDTIEQAKTIVIHCRGGSGRTGLMAAILLLENGFQWSEVKTLIQSVRPKALTLEPHLTYLQNTYSI